MFKKKALITVIEFIWGSTAVLSGLELANPRERGAGAGCPPP